MENAKLKIFSRCLFPKLSPSKASEDQINAKCWFLLHWILVQQSFYACISSHVRTHLRLLFNCREQKNVQRAVLSFSCSSVRLFRRAAEQSGKARKASDRRRNLAPCPWRSAARSMCDGEGDGSDRPCKKDLLADCCRCSRQEIKRDTCIKPVVVFALPHRSLCSWTLDTPTERSSLLVSNPFLSKTLFVFANPSP